MNNERIRLINLKTIRVAKGFTQTQMAEKLDITQGMYGRYERDLKTPMDRAEKIAEILEISVSNLSEKNIGELTELGLEELAVERLSQGDNSLLSSLNAASVEWCMLHTKSHVLQRIENLDPVEYMRLFELISDTLDVALGPCEAHESYRAHQRFMTRR